MAHKDPDEGDRALLGALSAQTAADQRHAELRETRRALADLKTRYLRLFDRAPVGYVLVDADAVIRRINPAGAALLGLTPGQAVRQALAAFVVPDDLRALRGALTGALRHGQRHVIELEVVRQGERRRLQAECVQHDVDDRTVLVCLVDVHGARRTTRALVESEARYRQLFDASRDALLLLGPDGEVAEVNRAASRLMARPAEDLVGRQLDTLLDELALTDATTTSPKVTPRPRDGGEVRSVEVTLSPVQIEGARTILVSMRDITERVEADARRRRLEVRLQEAHRLEAIGTLAGGIAHDMNNLLTVISSVASVLWEDVAEDGEYAEDIADILQACRRGQELTRNLLGFARKSSAPPKRIGVRELVDDVLSLVRRAASQDLTLEVEVDDDLDLRVDKSDFSRALMNLCMNARDATGGRGAVCITGHVVDRPSEMPADVSHPGPFVRLGVADDGAGMDSATLARAFEPFFTTKGASRGTGLGLSQVYGMVRAHGGWADIDSVPGEGTEVVLYLPALEVGVREVARTQPVPIAAHHEGRSVLLVDDDDAVRRSTGRLLERLGYAVYAASTGPMALHLYEARVDEIDAVVLDIQMPGMDGYAVYDQLRARDPALPILLYSGYVDGEHRGGQRVFDARTGFLAKPFSPAGLEERLDAVMAASEPVELR